MREAPFNAAAPGIRLAGITLRYGPQTVFHDLNLTLPGGELTAILGASGCGKSSLLRMVAGLQEAERGTITASDGLPLTGRIAWMGQRDLLYPWLSVRDNVMLSDRLRGQQPDPQRALALLAEVGLAEYATARPAALSGGMRQRAALARTLYLRAPIVLMDEPFSALDALTRAAIQTLAADKLRGRTVLLITHDPLEACRLGHRLQVLSPWPGALAAPQRLAGVPPRAPDNPAVLAAQGALLNQLMGAAL